MSSVLLFSLDRIEGLQAVLVGDDGTACVVPLDELPPDAQEGNMYRKVGENYVADPAAEQARREQVRALQNRLRRRNKK